ncbi:hypothetical protein D5272_03505 [bacterium D16-76]|nr:hypothetical protein [bacterium D16-76]
MKPRPLPRQAKKSAPRLWAQQAGGKRPEPAKSGFLESPWGLRSCWTTLLLPARKRCQPHATILPGAPGIIPAQKNFLKKLPAGLQIPGDYGMITYAIL